MDGLGTMAHQNLRKTSTTAAALHGFAFGLLKMVFMVTKTLQLCKNARLRYLAFEPAQGGLNAFVFSNSDLSHAEKVCRQNRLDSVALKRADCSKPWP